MMKVDPALLGFDFDGVIADTAETFLRLACEKYHHCDLRISDITSFEVEECLRIAPETIQAIFLEIMEDSIETGLQPMPGAVDVLGELAEVSEVKVITARPKDAPVKEWLDRFFPRSTRKNIRVIAMGDHDDKARHIRSRGLTHFIDDRAETCRQLARAGLNPIVFQQPWNRNRHNLPQVGSWEEIRALCLPKT